jgi:hypothetical protein
VSHLADVNICVYVQMLQVHDKHHTERPSAVIKPVLRAYAVTAHTPRHLIFELFDELLANKHAVLSDSDAHMSAYLLHRYVCARTQDHSNRRGGPREDLECVFGWDPSYVMFLGGQFKGGRYLKISNDCAVKVQHVCVCVCVSVCVCVCMCACVLVYVLVCWFVFISCRIRLRISIYF